MPTEVVELIFRTRRQGQRVVDDMNRSLSGANRNLTLFNRNLDRSDRGLTAVSGSARQGGESMVFMLSKALALVGGLTLIAAKIKDVVVQSTLLAARVETLGIVQQRVGQTAGIAAAALRGEEEEVRALGITTRSTRNLLARMVAVELDFTRASELANVARNAAVVANENTSATVDRLINGIVTQQIEVLRTAGIMVNFERAFQRAAKQLGITANQLTENQKKQIAFNEVVEFGQRLQGTYEAALDTTGKKLTTLPRLFEEAGAAIGTEFVRPLGVAVDLLSDFLRLIPGLVEAGQKNRRDAVAFFDTIRDGASEAATALTDLQIVFRNGQFEFRTGQDIERRATEFTADRLRANAEGQIRERLRTITSDLLGQLRIQGERAESERQAAAEKRQQAQLAQRKKFLTDVASLEQRAALAGLDALQRLAAQRDMEIARLGENFDLIQRVAAAYERLISIANTARERELRRAAIRLEEERQAIVQRAGFGLPERDSDLFGLRQRGELQAGEREARRLQEILRADDRLRDQIFRRQEARLRQQEQFIVRRIELLTGPGGEQQALRDVLQTRIRFEEAIFDRSRQNVEDLGRLRLSIERAVGEFQLQQLELQRRRIDEFRDAAGRTFDALTARGGGGLRDLFQGFLRTIQRQIFVNLATILFERIGDIFGGGKKAGGQKQQKGSILDQILRGTPFERQAKATEENTLILKEVNETLKQIQARLGGVAGTGVPVVGQGPGGVIRQGLPGSIGAAAGAAGGVARAVGGAGGILGSIAGAVGTALPFVGLGLTAFSLISSLFGGGGNRRRAQIENMIAEAQADEARAITRETTIGGTGLDVDFRGNLRPVGGQIVVQVNTMDAASFIDNRDKIAEAVRVAVQDNHPLRTEIDLAVVPR